MHQKKYTRDSTDTRESLLDSVRRQLDQFEDICLQNDHQIVFSLSDES